MSKRNETTTAITRVEPPKALMELAREDQSLIELREYRSVPRVKAVQAMSKGLRETHNEGDLVLVPSNVCVAKRESQGFLFVPLFFFPEFMTWKDIRDTSPDVPMIMGRSFDRQGEIAKKAIDPKLRTEEYGKFKMRHVEHLTFIGVIYGEHELTGTPISLSFSRGEYRAGRDFINRIMLRKMDGVNIPLWGQVWRVQPVHRKTAQYDWEGFDCVGTEPAFIKDDEVPVFRALNEEFKKLFSESRIRVEREGEEEEAVEATPEM